MSKPEKIVLVIGLVLELAAIGYILHYEGWKKGFQEGWCKAQPVYVRC